MPDISVVIVDETGDPEVTVYVDGVRHVLSYSQISYHDVNSMDEEELMAVRAEHGMATPVDEEGDEEPADPARDIPVGARVHVDTFMGGYDGTVVKREEFPDEYGMVTVEGDATPGESAREFYRDVTAL